VPSGTPIEEGGDKTNPSYQNYLAKQMLSDSSTQSLVSQMPSALPAVLVPPPGHEPKDPTPEEVAYVLSPLFLLYSPNILAVLKA
jgi:hypothetical protein